MAQADHRIPVAHIPNLLPESLSEAERAGLEATIVEQLEASNAALIAHYYVDGHIQDLAEATGGHVGDSLDMARFGQNHPAQTLLIAGVRFMGETAKILCPDKRVIMVSPEADCSLDMGCPAQELQALREQHPERTLVVYANTSAAVKALADWVVTSSVAEAVIGHLHARGEKILWAPDQYLGDYVRRRTGADLLAWTGACVVHEEFDADAIRDARQHSAFGLLVHPECPANVIAMADAVGSTSQMLEAVGQLSHKEFMVATSDGFLHKLRARYPDKVFRSAPTARDGGPGRCHGRCPWMAMNGLRQLAAVLQDQQAMTDHEVFIDHELGVSALVPLERMLAFGA
jgi:quinolinate synthase